jgi:hypothetical protein
MSGETLDDLIKQFETATVAPPVAAPAPPVPPTEQLEQAERDRHQRDAAAAEEMHRKNEQALGQAVRRFKDGEFANESDMVVEGFLLARARRDEAFSRAVSSGELKHMNRALSEARRDYAAALRKGYIEADNHRARASVRGGEPEAPAEFDAVRASRMSPEAYAADVAKRTGQSQSPYGKAVYWSGESKSVAARPWSAHDRGGGEPQAQGRSSSRPPMIGRGR